jgi:hypothetical protein
MHPLISDLSGLKTPELESKISDLTRKYFTSQNPDVRQQVVMILETYKEELAKRQLAEYNKMMNSRNKDLDKLINVQ